MNPYWLCCGSLVHSEHKRGCNEHLIGHPERRRFGTAEEHKEWAKECKHTVVIREEHLTGEGAMEYVEWYDYCCTVCGKKWTDNS